MNSMDVSPPLILSVRYSPNHRSIPMNNAAEDAVKAVICASAPEREADLSRMWDEHQPNVNHVDDRRGFTLKAGSFGLVLFNYKSMCQIWLLGFAAQYSFDLFLPYLFISQVNGSSFLPSDAIAEPEEKDIFAEISIIFQAIDELRESDDIDNITWPLNMPRPVNGKPGNEKGGMTFDLLCIASAYCFLHELRHVQLRNQGTNLDSIQEEHACDDYARVFLLDEIEHYAQQTGYNLAKLKSKRTMGIALASIFLLVVTPESCWHGSRTHPSVVSRIRSLTDAVGVSNNDYFWSYLACLLLSVFCVRRMSIDSAIVGTQREYCYFLLSKIDSRLTSSFSRPET